MATVTQSTKQQGGLRARRRRRARGNRAGPEARAGLLLVSPTVIVVLVVVVLPVLWALVLSFQRIRLIQLRQVDLLGGEYTLRNYEQLLSSSGFLEAARTTLVYSVFGTLGAIVLGLTAALLVRSHFRGRGVVRGIMLLPYVAPVVAIAFIWKVLLSPQLGFVNAVGTGMLGWESPIPFLSQEQGIVTLFGVSIGIPTALLMVVLFEAWKSFPFAFLFILARLQAIPADIEEAARVDGATPSQLLRHIILPQLASVIALIAVLRFIFTFNAFDEIYLLTGGAAGTDVLATQVYSMLTARADVGASAAVAMFMAAVLAVFLFVYVRYFGDTERAR
ncbi:MAG: Inner membrane ABC transporter permease protein YcjO [uncultured Solirubrobacteraceae bacterium]|uniref:Inner membrane ABC transporter permease protein YcjO n=1 Tax=uncultured Solirubrobacteraceae bacterium TaxID=1162706 RepID=A0A6J4S2J7_9ACTN|nr:MAG: Inner membrane ABC transporter permease protein YcjO [uncultured Solirubrobacteraceae bacterium]